jgi:hypothetical protein
MKRILLLAALAALAILALATTQVIAAAGPQLPGGTPGGPAHNPTPTGTLTAGQGNGPNPNAGQPTAGVPVGPPAQPGSQGQGRGKPTILRGTIEALDPGSLTLKLGDGTTVVVGLNPDTRIKVPGPNADGEPLTLGMQALVLARDEGGTLVAWAVIAIPGEPTRVHRVGTVTAYAAGSSITILAVDGNSYTFALTGEPKILPERRAGELAVGARVTIIAPRDPSATGWTATGIVVHPKLP